MLRQRLLHCVLALAITGGLAVTQVEPRIVIPANASFDAAVSHATARSSPDSPQASVQAATAAPRREVFGFALASSLADPTVGYPSWNFKALSTVAFFGLHINPGGTIAADAGWSVWSSSELANLVAVAHASGVRVVLTIVLQDFSPGTPYMCAGLVHRGTTVSQTVLQVAAKHVDGVNVDYEGLSGTCTNGQTSRAMMTDFVHQLRAALPSGAYLSVDTYASAAADPLGFFDVRGMNPYVDSFFVMAYDLEYSNWMRSPTSCSSFCLGPTAPLTGYYYNDETTVGQYVSAVGAAKVILGVPYYGRKACVGGVAPNAYAIGTVTADSYLTAIAESSDPAVSAGSYTSHRDTHDAAGQERWDTWFNTTLGCTRELYFDDATSLSAKYAFVVADGLRGVGIWNLNYGGGATELWNALLSRFVGCPALAVSTSPVSPVRAGAAVSFTAAASGCANPNPQYEFWMQAPGSTSWQPVRPYSTNAVFAWNTAGLSIGTYHFSVWVHDARSGGIYANNLGRWDSYSTFAYVVAPSSCHAVTVAFTPAAEAIVGSTVGVTAAASGCPNPRYEFWALTPGAPTWHVVQAYSASASLTWKTALPPGVYRWSVWARDASSPGIAGDSLGAWDAFSSSSYAVTRPCASVSATATPAAVARIGAAVSIHAAASGCPSPQYRFFVLAPGSTTWELVQDYGANATYAWSTGTLGAGLYQFSIWARDASSMGTSGDVLGRWDAYAAIHYSLFVPCGSAGATFSPASGAKVGVAVTITSAATECPHPLYELWVLGPGAASWQLVRSYGPAASIVWSTSGKARGTYQFSIWVRDSSSPGVAGDSLGSWDAYAAASYTLS